MGKHEEREDRSSKDHKEKKEKKDKKDKKDKREDKEASKDRKRRREDKEEEHEHKTDSTKKSTSSDKSESKAKENGHSSKKQKQDDKKDDIDEKNDDRDVDTSVREDSEEELLKNAQEEEVEPDDEAALDNFAISPAVKERLRAKGIQKLFPIQYETFDHILNGKDLVGKARTGTGKTFAFVLPTVERLFKTKESGKNPRVIVLTPTRELAKQIFNDFCYVVGKQLKVTCVYGGAPIGDQIRELKHGTDIIVGTPGRIMDLMERAFLVLEKIDHIILDEADEMLNRGFSEDVEKILSQVPKTNDPVTLLFSATIPPWVRDLVKKYLKPGYLTIDLIGNDENKSSKTVEHISLYLPHWEIKDEILADLIKTYSGGGRTIIFVKTKAEAVRLQNLPQLTNSAQSLHGDIKQDLREMALNAFKAGTYKILIATDVAARGLDIPQVELVLQTEPPMDYNTYIHRAGRTGRAGRSGRSLVIYLRSQKRQVSNLEWNCKLKFKKVGIPHTDTMIEMAAADAVHILQGVEPAVIPLFKVAAAEILKEFSPEEALARALAGATGYTKLPPPRSLFGRKDFQTLLLTTKRKGGYITKSTARNFLSDALGKNMPMNVYINACQDDASVVVDIAASAVAHLPPAEKCQVNWELIRELPELKDEEGGNNFNNNGNGRQWQSGGRYGEDRGGWGNSRGGYGNQSRGFGGNQNRGGFGNDNRGNPNDWVCDGCSYSNFASRSSCKRCNQQRGDGKQSSGGPTYSNHRDYNENKGPRRSWGGESNNDGPSPF